MADTKQTVGYYVHSAVGHLLCLERILEILPMDLDGLVRPLRFQLVPRCTAHASKGS